MASNAIFKVHYEENGQYRRIASLGIVPDYGNQFGKDYISTRNEVVNSIRMFGITYRTLYQDNRGNWNRGAIVQVVRVNGTFYLRTDSNEIAVDNLGELPEF
jgi:hypothetical protein